MTVPDKGTFYGYQGSIILTVSLLSVSQILGHVGMCLGLVWKCNFIIQLAT